MVFPLTKLLRKMVILLSLLSIGAADSCPDDLGQAPDVQPCLTPECVATSARVREFIDTTVDPCDDFYSFACGSWFKNQLLPPYKDVINAFEEIDHMIASVRNVLSTKPEPDDISPVRKAKDLFASCMNYEEDDEGSRSKALVDFINDEFGGWPLTFEEWDESQFDLENFITQAFWYGVSPLFTFGVDVFWQEDESGAGFHYHNLKIGTPSFSFPHEGWYEFKRDHVLFEAYATKLWEIANRFGIENAERAWDDIQMLLEMERELALFALKANEIADNVEEIAWALQEVQDTYGDILDWKSFITMIMASSEVGVTDVRNEEWIVNKVPSYFENITNYLQTVPKRTLANYIVWRVIDTLENVLVSADEKVDLFYKEAVHGKSTAPPTVERCVEYVSKPFELVVHRLLYAEKFPEEEIVMIQRMMKEVQQEFDTILENADWLDDISKNIAKEKNAAVITTFLLFDRAMNDTYLENYYKNLTFHRDDFFENLLMERQETVKKNLRLLRKPVMSTEYRKPYGLEAFNDLYENTIKYSAAMFEPPFLSRHIPQSLNYGAMGATLGHELTHAFDNDGYTFNKEGRKGNWWTEESTLNFQKRHKCMVDQYSKFYSEEAEMYLDGNRTLGENIADNGGLKEAFRAYRNYVCSLGKEEPPLPALNFTHNQLFFINFGQSFCEVINEEYAKWIVSEDTHSPREFRIIGSVQNSHDFAKAFKCPAGSKMNPEEKCEVW